MLHKRHIIKNDGRYLIYYAFDRPFPQVHPGQVAQGPTPKAPDPPPNAGQTERTDPARSEGGR